MRDYVNDTAKRHVNWTMRPSRPQALSRSSTSSLRGQKPARLVLDLPDDPRPEPFSFPRTHHLIITTSQGVYTYGHHGVTEIFRSGSKGIVAAKRATNGPRLLAVADDQVVILHDIRKGMRRSYRLRREDGRIHMLRFAKDPDRLFFTTTLQNAVQTYDLEHSQVLTPAFLHPSPPSVFALSSTSHLLLSASTSPPVIQLTNLLLDSRTLLLRPQCSSAAVVVVEFHPERGNIFVLAFADGTCAVYDAAHIFRDGSRGQRGSGGSGGSGGSLAGTGWEIAHIRNLYRPAKATARTHADSYEGLHTGSAPIDDHGVGVTAVGFVPGHKATVVTVGSDCRCCVVDFSVSEAHTANLICTWDIAGSPTSLSILTPYPKDGTELPTARPEDYEPTKKISVIAIGRQDGKVLFFDLASNLLSQQIPESPSHGILDVEWMEGDDWAESSQSQYAPNETTKSRSKGNRKSIGAVLASGRSVAEEVVAITDSPDAAEGSMEYFIESPPSHGLSLDRVTENSVPSRHNAAIGQSSAINHMDLPSAMKTPYPAETNYEDTSGVADTSSSDSLGSILRNFQFPKPPQHRESQSNHLQRKVLQQLPRNNSWALEPEQGNAALREDLYTTTVTERADETQEGSGKPARDAGPKKRHSSMNPTISTSSAPRTTLDTSRANPHHGHDREPNLVSATVQADAYQEDLWTDVTVDDGAPEPVRGEPFGGKEKSRGNDVKDTVANSVDDPSGRDLASQTLISRKGKQPGVPFAIHVDDRDQLHHPQPLRAHPEKVPSSGPRPLGPTNVNSSHPASAVRTAGTSKRYKNGNVESHRSSIYGPGALGRKVQQEVMISVNVELDVLRREMSQKFADQSRWFERELKDSQEWTLRVEDENRKLREELAKERKGRAVDREGIRTLC